MKACKHGTNKNCQSLRDVIELRYAIHRTTCDDVDCTKVKTCSCDVFKGVQCMLHFNLDREIIRKALEK